MITAGCGSKGDNLGRLLQRVRKGRQRTSRRCTSTATGLSAAASSGLAPAWGGERSLAAQPLTLEGSLKTCTGRPSKVEPALGSHAPSSLNTSSVQLCLVGMQ